MPAVTNQQLAPIVKEVIGIDGFLTPREIEFLALLAACPTAAGCILELGMLFGKSTVALAKGARLSDRALVHSVDLHRRDAAEENLRRAGVADEVRAHYLPSHDFWNTFDAPVRLFWHDGSNDRDYVAVDIQFAKQRLADRAIVAFHDVLNSSGERLHSFVDHVLPDPQFGRCGVVGSIGWAQFCRAGCTAAHTREKQRLAHKLARLKPFHTLPKKRVRGIAKIFYETYRQLVPHGAVKAERWLAQLA